MKKALCCLFAAVLALLSIPAAFATAPKAGETTYTNNFNSKSDVEDFQAYYILDAGQSQEESFDSHWAYESGAVKRVNDIVAGGGTKYIAALTLKDMTFKNFELSVKVQKVGSDWTWPVIAIRQNFPGKYFLDDGLGFLMQDEGKPTFWGSTGGPYEGTADSSYNKSAVHTFKIRALNDIVTVFVDGKQVSEKSFPTLNREGYISLMAVNIQATFDDFTITKLDDDGNPTSILEKEDESSSSVASTTSSSSSTASASSEEITSSRDTSSIDSGVYLGDLENGSTGGGSSTALWIFVIISDIVIIGGGALIYFFLILPKLPKK